MQQKEPIKENEEVILPDFELIPATFAEISGWQEDKHSEAMRAFSRSCGVMKDEICSLITPEMLQDDALAKAFFEENFVPNLVRSKGSSEGLFTGYHEIMLKGAREQSEKYPYPIYGIPDGLNVIDLGLFHEDLQGRSITGWLQGGKFVPLPTRAEIMAGFEAPILAYTDDLVRLFFMHIQGSGVLELEDGSILRIGYAAQNGHSYFAIGRKLVEMGLYAKEQMSAQIIKKWLYDNPQVAIEMMNHNPSYIFFRLIAGEGPIGSQGVPLIGERSLAVDRKFIPMGSVLWLETSLPDGADYKRLMVAQDTGGAIKGAIRGDIFFGRSERAEQLAGEMKNKGRYYLLVRK